MSDFKLFNRISKIEFEHKRNQFINTENKKSKKLLFYVGLDAGLYSELGGMLEALCWCQQNNTGFVLYGEDTNFSERGWNVFFEPFCEISVNKLNKRANYRHKGYYRLGKVAIPSLFIRRMILPALLKKREKVNFLTQDVFLFYSSEEFHQLQVNYPFWGVKGKMLMEYAKLSSLCLRYNEETYQNIMNSIRKLELPERYFSIQMRGGDKLLELSSVKGVEHCYELMEKFSGECKNFFVFTDDYRNISYIKEKRSDWNIYTLTKATEKGYYNAAFNKLDWIKKQKEIIKLFSMVEICIHSDYHIGCKMASVNNYIRSARHVSNKPYCEYILGEQRVDTPINKIKRIFDL